MEIHLGELNLKQLPLGVAAENFANNLGRVPRNRSVARHLPRLGPRMRIGNVCRESRMNRNKCIQAALVWSGVSHVPMIIGLDHAPSLWVIISSPFNMDTQP